MERWKGKVALVTGASSGIGAAITRSLVKAGVKVVGVARNIDRFAPLKKELEGLGEFHTLKCDVGVTEDLLTIVKWIEENLGSVDILINNAGVYKIHCSLIDGPIEGFRETINTNLLGVSILTREVIQLMIKKNVDGHIIFVNSVAGHYVPKLEANYNVYPATKYGITGFVETLRTELTNRNLKIKVSSLSPGFVHTNITELHSAEPADKFQAIEPEDCADAMMYMLNTPPNVQIQELTIRPVLEKF